MAYARFAKDSDVYVFFGGRYECSQCSIRRLFLCKTAVEMIEHLKEHQLAGDQVPEYCFRGLEEEDE